MRNILKQHIKLKVLATVRDGGRAPVPSGKKGPPNVIESLCLDI